MAGLPPDGRYLIQQIGGEVVLFETGTEDEIVRFNPNDADATAKAQFTIDRNERLNEEQKTFAHFWSGYFHAFAVM